MKQTSEAKRRSKAYGRMFSAFFVGGIFFVAGLIGYRLDVRLASSRWTNAPLLGEIGVGLGLLLLGVFWYRRLPDRYSIRRPIERPIRNVGVGRSAGAEKSAQGRRLPRGRS